MARPPVVIEQKRTLSRRLANLRSCRRYPAASSWGTGMCRIVSHFLTFTTESIDTLR
jgi:hypothetical protein